MSQFTCAMCGGTFTKARPDAEAIAEMERYFGNVPESQRAAVCDECFQKIHPEKHPEIVAAVKREAKS